MVQLKRWRTFILISLVAMQRNTRSGIWEFLCTIDNSLIQNGVKLRSALKKKLTCWKAKCQSYGGRLVLLNSVLSSLPLFMMSFFKIPKEVLKNLDHFRSTFFGKVPQRNINVDLQNGTSCVAQRIKGD